MFGLIRVSTHEAALRDLLSIGKGKDARIRRLAKECNVCKESKGRQRDRIHYYQDRLKTEKKRSASYKGHLNRLKTKR